VNELHLAVMSPLPILILAQLCAEAFQAYQILKQGPELVVNKDFATDTDWNKNQREMI